MRYAIATLGTLLCATLCAAQAEAQETIDAPPETALERAEAAYQNIDFEGTTEAAQEALEEGIHGPEALTRLYRLLGLATAAMGEERRAYEAFVRMLALAPDARVERNIAPQLRQPYLEARGFWSQRPPLGIELLGTPSRGTLVVRVRDAAELGSKVRVWALVPGGEPVERELDSQREVVVPIEGFRESNYVDVAATLVDEWGNALVEAGTEAAPRGLGERRTGGTERVVIAPRGPDPLKVVGGVALAVGLASGAVGVVFHAQREDLAQEWNSSDCEVPGQSRAEQCGDVRDDLDANQTRAIAMYAVGGALMIGGVALLVAGIVGADDEGDADVGFRCTPGLLGASCRASF